MTAITGSQYYRPSDLIALRCDDLSIRVVDVVTKKLVRELWGCAGQISDFVRSPCDLDNISADNFDSLSPTTAVGSLPHPWTQLSVSGIFQQAI